MLWLSVCEFVCTVFTRTEFCSFIVMVVAWNKDRRCGRGRLIAQSVYKLMG